MLMLLVLAFCSVELSWAANVRLPAAKYYLVQFKNVTENGFERNAVMLEALHMANNDKITRRLPLINAVVALVRSDSNFAVTAKNAAFVETVTDTASQSLEKHKLRFEPGVNRANREDVENIIVACGGHVNFALDLILNVLWVDIQPFILDILKGRRLVCDKIFDECN